jgi:hypothetical protein
VLVIEYTLVCCDCSQPVWHQSEELEGSLDVGYRGHSGKHLLVLSLTGFDVVDGARSRRRIAVR